MTDKFSNMAGDYTKRVFQGERKIYDQNGNEVQQTDIAKDVTAMSQRVSGELHGADLVMADDNIWNDTGNDGVIDDDNGEWANIFTQLEAGYGVDISDEDQKMLFDILDANGDGVLTSEEYSFLMHKDNGITGYSLWHSLAYRDDNYQENVALNSSDIYKGAIDSTLFDDPESKESKMLALLDDEDGTLKAQIDAADGKHVKLNLDAMTYEESDLASIADSIIAEAAKGENASYALADFEKLMSPENFKALSEMVTKAQEEAKTAAEVSAAQAEGIDVGALDYNIENILFAEESTYEVKEETTTAFTDAGIEITDENKDQVKFAQYLYQEFGLDLEGEDLKAFVTSLPTDKTEMQNFLLDMAKHDGGGTCVSNADIQKHIDYNVKGISSADVDVITENLASKEDPNAALIEYLNEKFGTEFTIDNFDIPEGQTLADVLFTDELIEDGKLTRAEIEALQKQEEATE